MQLKYLTDLDLSKRKVMLRTDMNVPLKDGNILNEERIDRSLPTIKYILEQGAQLILLSHLGRPKAGKIQKEFSLKPVVKSLEKKLNLTIELKDSLADLSSREENLVMLENIRFFEGEENNDSNFSRELASHCDVFIMDAFATSHRAHASTTGAINFADFACAGFLIKEELQALEKINTAKRPVVTVLGGAKISTKLSLINSLSEKADHLILGGGLANTCLGAQGIQIGTSLTEISMYEEARKLSEKKNIILPKRVLVAKSKDSVEKEVDINFLKQDDCIFDVSPSFIYSLEEVFSRAGTIIWNGPMGLFELEKFSFGTKAVASLVADSEAYSIIGGGDTVSAANASGVIDSIGYISTGGGAFLEYLEGKSLPSLVALEKKALESSNNGA